MTPMSVDGTDEGDKQNFGGQCQNKGIFIKLARIGWAAHCITLSRATRRPLCWLKVSSEGTYKGRCESRLSRVWLVRAVHSPAATTDTGMASPSFCKTKPVCRSPSSKARLAGQSWLLTAGDKKPCTRSCIREVTRHRGAMEENLKNICKGGNLCHLRGRHQFID